MLFALFFVRLGVCVMGFNRNPESKLKKELLVCVFCENFKPQMGPRRFPAVQAYAVEHQQAPRCPKASFWEPPGVQSAVPAA